MNKKLNPTPPITPIVLEIENELSRLITKANNNGITLIACISISDPDNKGYQFNHAKFTGESEEVLNSINYLMQEILIDIAKAENNYSQN